MANVPPIKPLSRIVRAKHGNFLILVNDFISHVVEKYGEWSEKEVQLYSLLLKKGGTVFEIGAHIGTHAVPLSRLCKRLYCFEPQPIPFQALSANLLINQCAHVTAHPYAIGAKEEWLHLLPTDFTIPTNSGAYEVIKNSSDAAHGVPTQCMRLDYFWHLIGKPKIDFMKVDVEGMEEDVLRGAEELLLTWKPSLLLESNFWKTPHSEKQADEFYSWLSALGYTLHWFCPFGFNPDNFNQIKDNSVGESGDVNVLALPIGQPLPMKLVEYKDSLQILRGEVPWL